jgi:hypothetical protein
MIEGTAAREAEYADWIATYVQGRRIVGECQRACEEMRQAFPELELRGGFARTPLGRDLHYWLRAPWGTTVDPTASQFGGLALEDYEDAGTTDAMTLLRQVLIFPE